MFFDELLQHLGEFGRYQRRVYFLACMIVIPTAWHIAIQVFTAGYADYWCKIPDWEDTECTKWNLTDMECKEAKRDAGVPKVPGATPPFPPFEQCMRYNVSGVDFYPGLNSSAEFDEILKCDAGWEYDTTQYKTTIITDVRIQTFDLVCSRSTYPNLAQSIFFTGVLIGSSIFGGLADRIGRHPALFMCVAIQAFLGIGISFAPNFPVYIVLRCLLGFGNNMVLILAFVMGTEFVGPSKRVYAGVSISFILSAGNMSLALLAFLIRKWRILQFVLSAYAFLSLCLYPFMPESVRWLISKGKHKQARELIHKVAEVNKVEIPDELLSTEKMQEDEKRAKYNIMNMELELWQQSFMNLEVRVMFIVSFVFSFPQLIGYQVHEPTSSMLDIFRYPKTRIRMIILMWIAMVNSFLFYGLTLSAGSLSDLTYLAFFSSGAVEIPAYLVCMFFLDRVGRRPILAMFFFIAGIACLVTTFLPLGIPNTVVAMIGKFGAAGAIMTLGMGLAAMFVGLGSILAPVFFILAQYWEPLPMVIFGVGGILAGFPTLLLPETMGENLPETMEEGERFGIKKKHDKELYNVMEEDEIGNAETATQPNDKEESSRINGTETDQV
ncbi:organic cation transporter protein-like [Amphiura filiformis]|uniref:organic cation transporter protein-like n=1 Tax=Amphiura filiformis TaxID=82378 RepID=UPI003B221648